MEILGVVAICVIIFIWLRYKFNKFRNKKYKFFNIIVYTANFLAKNPRELAIIIDDVYYADLLEFVNENPSIIMGFKQIDSSAITFDVVIEGRRYGVIGRNYIMNKLSLVARAL
ncbi:hypothetical protein [Psychrobacter alimentarius]|jgi:hypothetical protein|uniref:hypothetical protein n=1 Tax=Psychrobacter alimentarius TaxID=261164 RepID=UPI001917C120|nr:hypothetical protein [Psychrobacter alimentarius]